MNLETHKCAKVTEKNYIRSGIKNIFLNTLFYSDDLDFSYVT